MDLGFVQQPLIRQIMNKEAAEILAAALEEDAQDHESGKYTEIGLKWDDVYGQILPIEDEFDNPI
jgi:hypothetical protein